MWQTVKEITKVVTFFQAKVSVAGRVVRGP